MFPERNDQWKIRYKKILRKTEPKKSDSITVTEEKAYVFLHESEVDFDCCSYFECIILQKMEQAENLLFMNYNIEKKVIFGVIYSWVNSIEVMKKESRKYADAEWAEICNGKYSKADGDDISK